jgi:TonB family protein
MTRSVLCVIGLLSLAPGCGQEQPRAKTSRQPSVAPPSPAGHTAVAASAPAEQHAAACDSAQAAQRVWRRSRPRGYSFQYLQSCWTAACNGWWQVAVRGNTVVWAAPVESVGSSDCRPFLRAPVSEFVSTIDEILRGVVKSICTPDNEPLSRGMQVRTEYDRAWGYPVSTSFNNPYVADAHWSESIRAFLPLSDSAPELVAPPPRPASSCQASNYSLCNLDGVCWDTRPKPTLQLEVAAPTSCRNARDASLLVHVSARGSVIGKPVVTDGSGCVQFDRAAANFVTRATFIPARKKGRPVSAWVKVDVSPR